jgi:DNA-binding NarL/FixJ family response regulator
LFVGHIAILAVIMESLDHNGLNALRQAVRQLGGSAARFDRAGLVALAGTTGQNQVTILPADADLPAIVVIGRESGRPSGTFDALSGRERQVAALIGDGCTNKEIASELWISVGTVKDHVHHILAKTGLANRAALAGRWRFEHTD